MRQVRAQARGVLAGLARPLVALGKVTGYALLDVDAVDDLPSLC